MKRTETTSSATTVRGLLEWLSAVISRPHASLDDLRNGAH